MKKTLEKVQKTGQVENPTMFLEMKTQCILKLSVLLRSNYKFDSVQIKLLFFFNLGKRILKFLQKISKNAKENLNKERLGELALSGAKIYHKASAIKMMWYWHMNAQVNRGNVIESPEEGPTDIVFQYFIKVSTEISEVCHTIQVDYLLNATGST